jgi:hypothetical protein
MTSSIGAASETYGYDYDEPADFDTHWENTIGNEWDDECHEASSIIDESSWEELDMSGSSDESYGGRSDTEHLTGTSERNDTPESPPSADNMHAAPADTNTHADADELSNTVPITVDDTTLQTSHVSLRRRKAPSDNFEEPFCSDCELIIYSDHLLKCSEPSCTEKVC